MPHTQNDVRLGALTADAVLDELRGSLLRCGRAVLLVPSFTVALDAQRTLAAHDDLAVGITVTFCALGKCSETEVVQIL